MNIILPSLSVVATVKAGWTTDVVYDVTAVEVSGVFAENKRFHTLYDTPVSLA
jgi:hypothetical protein